MTKFTTNLSSLRSLRLRLTQAKQAMRPDSLGEHVTVTGKERNKKRTMRKYKMCFLHVQNDSKSADPGRRAQYIFTCVGPKKCHEVPNPKSKIQNLHIKICYITLQNPESKIRNPKSKIRNPKSEIQSPKIRNPKSKTQNPKSKTKIPQSKIQNLPPNCYITIQNPTSKIQNSQNSAEKVWILDWGILDFRFRILDFGFWILSGFRGCTTRQFSDGTSGSEARIPPGPPQQPACTSLFLRSWGKNSWTNLISASVRWANFRMVTWFFWEGSWREGRLTQNNWNATWLSGKVLGAKVDLQKNPKRHMVFWEGSWREGRLAKKKWNATWISGLVLVAKVDSQKKWNATWFSGKVLGAKVDSQKKIETPHGFLGRFLARRSTHQKKTFNAT